MMRCGLILKKIGMTRFFQDDGIALPVTVLKLENTQVVKYLNKEKNGYTAIQIGSGDITKSIKFIGIKATKSAAKQIEKAGGALEG